MAGDMYEEVEPFHGVRPVVIFGALADLISSQLIEDFPTEFYPAPLGLLFSGFDVHCAALRVRPVRWRWGVGVLRV